jgi:hypothetical protein
MGATLIMKVRGGKPVETAPFLTAPFSVININEYLPSKTF